MADIFDYLKWRGDLTFAQDPPNRVDALIFSTLSYLSFGGRAEAYPERPISLLDASEDFFRLPDIQNRYRVKTDLSLLMAAAETKRFGAAMVTQYRSIFIPTEDTQFAAVTFLLDDGSAFLAYRGTDSSLVGWKEDFNMTFQETIPAQRLALQYAQQVAEDFPMPLRLGGHSKGGNLAVFAAVKAPAALRARILGVYNHDGPGFTGYLLDDPVYREMIPRIDTTVPQSSVIGMLLEHEEPYTIIRSTRLGLMQHDPYSWEVMGRDFLPMEEITADSHFLNLTIKRWLADMSIQERNQVVDAVFGFFSLADVNDVSEIMQPKSLSSYIHTLRANEKTRKLLSVELVNLLEAARKTQMELENAEVSS